MNYISVNPYANTTRSQEIAARDLQPGDNLSSGDYINNKRYYTDLLVGKGGTATAQFFPYNQADNLQLFVGENRRETGFVSFENENESVILPNGTSSSGVPQGVSFYIQNETEKQKGNISNWRLIITVTNPVNVINPLQSVSTTAKIVN